jgi:hypothetical protein
MDTRTYSEQNMQTNRTDFEAGFAFLGLDTKPAANNLGAVAYPRQFKKCSILTEVEVSYSSSASAGSGVSHLAQKK